MNRKEKDPPEIRILVCLSSSTSNARVIRAAARIADAFQGTLTALFVETPTYSLLSGGDTASLERTENDFTPMLSYIRAAGEELGGSWMWDMHMPGIYGAWMAAMDPEEPEIP